MTYVLASSRPGYKKIADRLNNENGADFRCFTTNEELTARIIKKRKPSLAGCTVLITGAGGAVIPLLIRLLKAEGCRVLAVDMDPDAVGLFLADKGYIIPGGLSAEFVPAMRRICQREKVDALIPLVDEELISVWQLARDGLHIILPEIEFVRLCLDKWRLMQTLRANNINVPQTRLANEDIEGLRFPLIVKPRTGRGSRGVALVNSYSELKEFLSHSPYSKESNLIQEYIDGSEFTISVVVWRDGLVKAVVPKKIISKKGITRIAVSRRNSKIDALCRQVQEKLRANGPFNVQLRLDSSGEPYIFEINPRFSTSISLTIAAGLNELVILLKQALLGIEAEESGDWREGVVLLRQTMDCFLDENEFQNTRNDIVRNNTFIKI